MGRDLGQFSVPVQFVPPNGAEPGDSATLLFMGQPLKVTVPWDWTPGQALLFEPPKPSDPQLNRPHQRRTSDSPGSLEHCLGLVTAGVGVFGLIAGSAYIGTVVPGSLGFALGGTFLVVAGSFYWKARRDRRLGLARLENGVLLTGALVFGLSAVGTCFGQTVSNLNHWPLVVWLIMSWVASHIILVGLICRHLTYVCRLTRSASFLPWFAASASCLVVLFIVLWMLFDVGMSEDSMILHGTSLALACTSAAVGCVAPRALEESDGAASQTDGVGEIEANVSHANAEPVKKDPVALLPSIMASMAVGCLGLVCLSTPFRAAACLDCDEPPKPNGLVTSIYASGFLAAIAVSTGLATGDVAPSVTGFQATCLLLLVALVAMSLDASPWERWLVSISAPIALWWSPALKRRVVDAVDNEGSNEPTEPSLGQEVRRPWQKLWSNLVCDSNVQRLACTLLLCSEAAVRARSADPDEADGSLSMNVMPLFMAVPLWSLMCYLLASRGDFPLACNVAVSGWFFSLLPYRFMISDHAVSAGLDVAIIDIVFEICLVFFSVLLITLSRLLQSHELGFLTKLFTALCLLCHDRIAPLGILFFGMPAAFIAWRSNSWLALAVTCGIWEVRGGASAFESVPHFSCDHLLIPGDVVALLVGIGATLMVVAGLFGGEEMERGVFLAGLLLVPSFITPIATRYAAFLVALGGVALPMARPSILRNMFGLAVVWASCQSLHVQRCTSCWGVGHTYAFVSSSALMFALRATIKRSNAANVAWLCALLSALLAVVMMDNDFPFWVKLGFALLHLFSYTAALLLADHPRTLGPFVWYTLPGVWVLMLAATSIRFSVVMLVTLPIGIMFVLNGYLASCTPASLQEVLRRIPHELSTAVEICGMLWMAAGSSLGLYMEGAAAQFLAMLVMLVLGASQLVRGLLRSQPPSKANPGRSRRIGGLLSISLGIFLGAGATQGLVQGLLILVGSMLAIGLSILVASIETTEQQKDEEADDSREVLVQCQIDPAGPGPL